MNIRAERMNRGLSVEEVCDAVEVLPATYRYYERTGGQPRDTAVAKRIADYYGVRVTDLWPVEAPSRDAAA